MVTQLALTHQLLALQSQWLGAVTQLAQTSAMIADILKLVGCMCFPSEVVCRAVDEMRE